MTLGSRMESFGPAERLYAAVRRRAPQVAASIVRDDEAGLPRVHLTYGRTGRLIVAWDGTAYRRWSGRGHSDRFGADPEEAADRIAVMLGAQASPAGEHP
ncbi:hypothetical protein [Spirillospora sp. CA-128828]|uniref:hypothetical protein n=1 Tax=Spirillospora sp. CA-128828 TaxID=3240033 RepID=UPI003D9208A8